MKLISWNVNGLRACMQKGFLDFFQETDADIFCLQETKLQEGQIALDLPGYHQYWNYAEKKCAGPSLLPEAKIGDLGSFCSKIVVMLVIEWYTALTAYTICGS